MENVPRYLLTSLLAHNKITIIPIQSAGFLKNRHETGGESLEHRGQRHYSRDSRVMSFSRVAFVSRSTDSSGGRGTFFFNK